MRIALLLVRRLLCCCLVLVLPACVDPYTPDVLSASRSYLVVDGFINSQGNTSIKLSRTFAISSLPKVPAETRATVAIEDQTGLRYPLAEGVAGTYSSGALTLNPARTYRLRITTAAGLIYVSDYVPVKTTPPVDAVEWRAESAGLGLYVSAHDDTRATQYYRWEYTETWEIVPLLSPSVEYVSVTNAIRAIRVPFPSQCWGTEQASVIQLAKTTALNRDEVAAFPLRRLARTSNRLYSRYSILVQQHALTKDEYAYWEQLRKNTESLGTLFDPQPSQLTGNVHCLSSATELAFGFVGAHSLTERRIFVDRVQLPFDWPYVSGYEGCYPPDTLDMTVPDPFRVFRTGVAIPVSAAGNGFTVSTLDCVDCRRRGSAVRPSFW